ncbi:MAG: HPr-rel-A system PqqD family peptide chaperone [Ignavibacteriaceae bacterium]|jgi:PqqD family protein of HPr-rel-A system
MTNYHLQENLAVSDSGFLFHASTGETFTVNETGKTIIKLLQQKKEKDEIFSQLVNEFDIEAGLLEKDYEDFINQLKNFSLIEVI